MTNETTYDSNEEALAEAILKAELKVLQEAQDLAWILSDARGRRFVWKLLADANVFVTPRGATDHDTFINVGRKERGLELLAEVLQNQPELFVAMMNENNPTHEEEQS